MPGALQPLAADAICAKLRFDPVTRNLYYACNEDNHIRISVGHVSVGQRTGIQYTNYNAPRTPGGGQVLNLFPSLTTDKAGNVYVAWIDRTNFNLYYSFSTDQGKSWSAPVRVNNSGSATNEFDWAEAGNTGQLALAWYGTPRTAVGGSDAMPSSLTASVTRPRTRGTATRRSSRTPTRRGRRSSRRGSPRSRCTTARSATGGRRARPTCRPTGRWPTSSASAWPRTAACASSTTTRRTSSTAPACSWRGRSAARRFWARTSTARPRRIRSRTSTGDAQFPHYSPAGVGANLPQLDLTGLKVSNPTPTTLRFKLTVADLSQMTPPPGKTAPLWLVRFQALGPLANDPRDVYHTYYVYMEKTANAVPQFYGGVAACQTTTPTNCKIFQYRGDTAVEGSIDGNTITIDAGLNTGFGVPIDGTTLYNVTAFTFGRNDSFDDLYADVDATPPFDYALGSVKK